MNFTHVEMVHDRETCLGLARMAAPYKTGNVRFNAMSAFMTNDGFAIKYSLPDAFYIYFLEEGTRYTKRHQGFIGNKTVYLLSAYLQSKYAFENKASVAEYQQLAVIGSKDPILTRGWSRNAEKVAMFQERTDRNLASIMRSYEVDKTFGWEHKENIQNEVPSRFAERK